MIARGTVAAGSVPEANMRQRRSRDPEVQGTKSLDCSVPLSKVPSSVTSDEFASIAETRDDHAVDQIDGDVF